MALPSQITGVTVSARYITADGRPASGRVAFQPTGPLQAPAADVLVPVVPVIAELDSSGAISVTLAALDDPDVQPTGQAYLVNEEITGAPIRQYFIQVPASLSGSGLQLADVAPAPPADAGVYTYLLASAAPTDPAAGVAGLRTLGTGATQAAAGNHTHAGGGIGALIAAENLADLDDVPTARTNLGLGGAAVLAVGTTAGTVAAGDDPRIVGAAQKAANLSDLESASTARTSLGLGAAATLGVGTTAGTVAAGDHTHAGGGGVTPAAGTAYRTTTNLVTTSHNSTWEVTTLGVDIPAAVGDTLLVWIGALIQPQPDDFLDLVVVGAGSAIVRRASTGTASAPGSNEGEPALYPSPGTFRTVPAPFQFVVTSDDLVSGNVQIRVASRGNGNTTVYAAAYPCRFVHLLIPGA